MVGGRTPYWSMSVPEHDARRLVEHRRERLAGDRVDEVVGRAQDQRHGHERVGDHLHVADDLGLLGRDREDHDLLLLVQGRARARSDGAAGCSGGRCRDGRQQRAEDLHALEDQLGRRALGPGLVTVTTSR